MLHIWWRYFILFKVLVYKLRLLRDDSYRQSYRRVYGTFTNLEYSYSAVCNRCVKESVTYVYFVREYAAQFNTDDFSYKE